MAFDQKEYDRIWRKFNGDKVLEYQRRYLAKPEVKERRAKYYRERNRERRAAMTPEELEAYKAKQREYHRKYCHKKKIEKLIKTLQAEGYTVMKEVTQ